MDDNVALPEPEIKYEVGPAGDVETKRESAPKAIARRSPVAIALGLLIVALLGYRDLPDHVAPGPGPKAVGTRL